MYYGVGKAVIGVVASMGALGLMGLIAGLLYRRYKKR